MSDKLIISNKLIAEYMGHTVTYIKETEEYGINGEPLSCYNYNTSWDMLIPVVEYIESLDLNDYYDENNFMGITVDIAKGNCFIFLELNYDPPYKITGKCDYDIPKITLIYSQVVKFIKWYNYLTQ